MGYTREGGGGHYGRDVPACHGVVGSTGECPWASEPLSRPRYPVKREGEGRRGDLSWPRYVLKGREGEGGTCLGLVMTLTGEKKGGWDLARPRYARKEGGGGGLEASRSLPPTYEISRFST